MKVYTKLFYDLHKKDSKHIIMTLTKFSNGEISTPINPMSWDESWDQNFDGDIVNQKDGEVVLQYNENAITYISSDYRIDMRCEQYSVEDEATIQSHDNYIKWRQRG